MEKTLVSCEISLKPNHGFYLGGLPAKRLVLSALIETGPRRNSKSWSPGPRKCLELTQNPCVHEEKLPFLRRRSQTPFGAPKRSDVGSPKNELIGFPFAALDESMSYAATWA